MLADTFNVTIIPVALLTIIMFFNDPGFQSFKLTVLILLFTFDKLKAASTETVVKCFHCGEDCNEDHLLFDDKDFCCTGCKLVYEVLSENDLCNYYQLENQPGNTQKLVSLGDRFSYLDSPEIVQQLIYFSDNESMRVRFHIPAMHCSSCIWLLEHLNKIHSGILYSQSDFIRREVNIAFKPSSISLRKLVEILYQIGYPPEINLNSADKSAKDKKSRNTRIYKIGVAGFAFGNIMLLSFPEYFSNGSQPHSELHFYFSLLNILLAIPVFFYSASEFLINALLSFRQRVINIDVPIAIGIVAMFGRSLYEIISQSGPGYFDSMTGLVFFMLIGRNFQSKTYQWLSFDRDYKSYFPIAVTRIKDNVQSHIPVQDIRLNDRLFIRINEIIPADVILISEKASIDYSFVSGESRPVEVSKGGHIYAGARLIGTPVEVVVVQVVSLSHLTKLWNQSSGKQEFVSGFKLLTERISRWFVFATFLVATGAFMYWYSTDLHRALHAFTSVLVIACACALALSAPFTFGNIIRILGRQGIYLKDSSVIEKLADIDSVVFDKTGTLTYAGGSSVEYDGIPLSELQMQGFKQLAASSVHPLSRRLSEHLSSVSAPPNTIENVGEISGMGMSGVFQGMQLKMGNSRFTGSNEINSNDHHSTSVYLNIDGKVVGRFLINGNFRPEMPKVINQLRRDGYSLSLLSGDADHELNTLRKVFNENEELKFRLSPAEKRDCVDKRMKNGEKVMMLGDGLNDAGALMQSLVGLTLTENINNFSPGCDGILLSDHFASLPALLKLARSARRIIIISFIISLIYNFIGLWFAVQGTLSPVIAAILMPISTSSLVVYTVLAGSLKARRLGLVNTDKNHLSI